MPKDAPKAEGAASPGFEIPDTLAKFDQIDVSITEIHRDAEHTRHNVKSVQNTNWVIIIVLAVAFVGLLFTAIFTFIQTIKSDTQSRDVLIQSVEQLRTEIEILKANQN